MADNLTTMLVRLGLIPLMWVLRLLIIIAGKYLANLLTLFFYLEHVLDNLNKLKIPPKNRKTKANSKKKALKYLERIVQHHRKKHLKLRNKIKFRTTLLPIDEADETDQTPCNSPYLPPSNQPPNNIPSPVPTSKNPIIPTPRAIQPLKLDPNFSNYSFLIPDFIVPSDSTPSNFNTNFSAQFNHYIQQKNSRKPFRYIKQKYLHKTTIHQVWKMRLEEENGLFHLVPVLLKEHLLNEQMLPPANIGNATVHFHRTAVFTEHPGRF
ncbi:hypothetical protein TNCV_4631191 [Trichonephila clavipes]|nr:hypothetical protein TNCV_4631191 [Trichonephila clavipes]